MEAFPRDQADRCVLCGLCLPSCPTYLKTGDENESPRGRIALMRAMAGGKIAVSAKLEAHLDRCLACRACERVCPSLVEYGALIEAGRALLSSRRPHTRSRLLGGLALSCLVERPRMLGALVRLLRLYQRSGLQRLMRAAGIPARVGLAKLDSALPRLAPQEHWRTVYPAHGATRAQVALFTGCIGRVADQETLRSAIGVLNLLGYEVRVPPAQGCCGALHLHAGRPGQAHALMRKNLTAFADDAEPENGGTVIVHAASGCGATLSEYGRHLPSEAQAGSFTARLADISRFLAQAPWPEGLTAKPLPKTVAVHDPCSLRNVLHDEKWPYALLARIPEIRLVPVAENHLCCGGAGAYPLTQATMAEDLLADKIGHLRRLAPDLVVSANIGCALHLAKGLARVRPAIEVIHPVTLLYRQLRPRA